ncbi:protein-L-isoaspartate O-methyltransferase family protein [Halobellus limi]|jgi:protein-L-isoaspartate(D-aspartate) O-methyltransferase|uniref:protein-L-isoaspartate(D-aspartate) O-methyltransferase n=1 Tax=Halobellus limi TaxID=699433 RepID=A0A1H5YCZ7_9EURY|nr:protein-L-isoaspartate O-methyltransferase [Halobellus limi]QCC48493.1 protein-L-isoaspartate O-methyltransferase [Halobellus limi]SEG21888.1 protein-L-isoaspartate(D-aspartate) O-methyltransferase [Halobellus limi]
MDPGDLRGEMVDGLEERLSIDDAVALAMRTVPRRTFVDDAPYDGRSEADGTTVLAPEMVARLLTALDVNARNAEASVGAGGAAGTDRTEGADGIAADDAESTGDVLVVGAGVGYTAAILAELVGETRVHAVDIDRRLVYAARSNLESAGYGGVLVDARDGARGLPEYAPFDRILVEAAAIEPPKRLVEQLAPGGRLVLPLGGPEQSLAVVDDDGEVVERCGPVAFKPLLVDGEQGSAPARNRTEREDAQRANEPGYFAKTGWEQEWIDWDEQMSRR